MLIILKASLTPKPDNTNNSYTAKLWLKSMNGR